MADLFSRLTDRSQGRTPLLRPRPRSLFEPAAPLAEAKSFNVSPMPIRMGEPAIAFPTAVRQLEQRTGSQQPRQGPPANAQAEPAPDGPVARTGMTAWTDRAPARVTQQALIETPAPASIAPASGPQTALYSVSGSARADAASTPDALLPARRHEELAVRATASAQPGAADAPAPPRTPSPVTASPPSRPLSGQTLRRGRSNSRPEEPPVIRVEIGRIEVRASPASAPSPPARPSGLMPLDRYLRSDTRAGR